MNRIHATSPLGRFKIADSTEITPGQLVALNSAGNAVPAADTAGLKIVGIAKMVVDGEVEVFSAVVGLVNGSSGAALARTDRGAAAYVVDAGTVGKTSTNKIIAGIVVDVYDGEVFVAVDPVAIAAATAADAAAAAATA